MKRQWQSLSPRGQVATAVLTGGALVALALLGVIMPLQDWRAELADEQAVLGRELQAVQDLARELQQLQRNTGLGPASGVPQASLSALVEQSLQGRPFQPSRLQVNESGQMQLRLDAVPFDAALGWLHELENYPGILATSVSVNGVEGGRVSVGLTLQQL